MNIGDKHILVSKAPFFYSIHNEKETKVITISIIEKRKSKGEFTGKEGYGFLAKGSDGYYYGYDYPNINEGFSSGVWNRCMPNEEDDFLSLSTEEKEDLVKDYIWHDVTKFQCPAIAVFAINNDFIDYCEKHQLHYYKRNSCTYCKNIPEFKQKTTMNMEEHAWKNWY